VVNADPKENQTITFEEVDEHKTTDEPFALTATASSNLTVTFTSSNNAVATISGSMVTITGAGTTTITASQPGNEEYDAAPNVTHTLTVVKADQAITFAALPSRTVGDQSFALSATASSGLPVHYAITSDKISINGSQVSIVKAGKATITASQPGNDDYNGAKPVDQTFCVNPSKPVITTIVDGTQLKSSADIGNQWYVDGAAIEGAIATTYEPTKNGSYTVIASVDGCTSVTSDATAFVMKVISGLEDMHNSSGMIYPNPVSSVLHVDLSSFEEEANVEVSVYDMFGKRIESMSARKSAELATGEYKVGMYLLVASQNGKAVRVKFVKK